MNNHQTPREYMFEQGMDLIVQTYNACINESRNGLHSHNPTLITTTLFYLFAEMSIHTIIEKHVYDFWFYKLLSEPSEKFLSILEKQNYILFQKDERSVAVFVERYVKTLNENKHQEKSEKIIRLALSQNIILNVSFLKALKGFSPNEIIAFEKLSTINSQKLLEKNTQNLIR